MHVRAHVQIAGWLARVWRPYLAAVSQALAFAIAATVFLLSIWLVWTAFTVPFELEVREGTVWLHALAKKAGVDIYNPERVVFVNMNHGPMDGIVKAWLARAFPSLPGWMLIRLFVLVLPAVLLASGYFISRNLTAALAAAAATHLCLVSMSLMVVVGRTDPTALCGLAIAAALAAPLLAAPAKEWAPGRVGGAGLPPTEAKGARPSEASGEVVGPTGGRREWRLFQGLHNRRHVAQVLLGATSAMVFLTTWRFAPTVATIHLIVLIKQVVHAAHSRWRAFLCSVSLSAVGFALVWVPVLLFELHGDLKLYYRRFFGFFSTQSGWGLFPGSKFHLFPAEITRGTWGLLLLIAGLMLLAFYRIRRDRAELVAWLVLLPAGWVGYAYVFYKNQSGGGTYYFFPVILLAWLLILRALPRGRARPFAQLALVCLVACLVPWRGLLAQQQELADARAQAKAFLRAVAVRAGNQPVFSEDLHLFKTRYREDQVDTGDSAAIIAATGYFGDSFSRTFKAYTERLHAHPPRFVMAGLQDRAPVSGAISDDLRRVLQERYEMAVDGPARLVVNNWAAALFERP